MSAAARIESSQRCDIGANAFHHAARGQAEVFEASFEAVFYLQDGPRASMASRRLLAITMLARPNRLNSCAAFLARPL
jgi:predicted secreted protein